MAETAKVTCNVCGNAKEPELVEGRRRSLPTGWVQVQIVNHTGRVNNAVLCQEDARKSRVQELILP